MANGRLHRTFKDGISRLNAYLDDYAFYINALLDIFEVDANPKYLEKAIAYTDSMIQHFWDSEEGNFFFTSNDHEQLIVRTKNLYDLAIPSGNSMAASNLLRLYYITQNNNYLDKAEQVMRTGSKAAAENPFGFGQLLIAIYLYVSQPLEITVIRKNTDKQSDSQQMSHWLGRQFIPNGIVTVIKSSSQLEELQKYSFFNGKKEEDNSERENQKSSNNNNDNSEYAFVCKNFTCSVPIHSLQDLQRHIDNNSNHSS
jgi:uncharacterized protein YyaL (SSP411 family)